jgi:hypothetical protein
MNRTARRYVFLALGCAGLLIGGLVLLNFIVDPFNRYGLNRLGVFISAERECKATYVTRFPHDALLLGNSRQNRTPPGQLAGFHFFNAAISGATSEEIYYFLQHFAHDQRLVVLNVDAGEQDSGENHGDIFAPKGLLSARDNLLNLQTTGYSLQTIFKSFSKHPQRIGLDGTVPEADWVRVANRDNPQEQAFAIQALQRGWEGYHCPPPARMAYYAKISECLRERGILCVVVIPPMHEAVAQSLQSSPAAAEVAAWKRQLGTIFPHVLDLSFSSYGAATNFYPCDPIHFKTDVDVSLMNHEVLPFATRLLNEKSPSAAKP